MQKNRKISNCAIVLICLLSLITGCGNQEEAPTEPVAVKSFKIDKTVKPEPKPAEDKVSKGMPGEKEDAGEVALKMESPESDKVTAVDTIDPDESSETALSEESSLVEKPVEESVKEVGDELKDSIDKDKIKSAVGSLPDIELDEFDESDSKSSYNPKGRVDPFEPLFQAKEEALVEKTSKGKYQTIRDSRRGKLTPLEKLDLSQLKLTAIILSPNRNIAMVKESTGKGHVIKKGTYIGINSGRVVEIKKNIVIIEEEVEDYLGKIRVQKRELKLQKPLGER